MFIGTRIGIPMMQYGTAFGSLNFSCFQEILDFTATGSESSTSVAVDGDTDKEYIILSNELGATDRALCVRLNNDSGSNYGLQDVRNSAGTLSAQRSVSTIFILYHPSYRNATGLNIFSLLTPTGFIKTLFGVNASYGSGTTIDGIEISGQSWNSTSNVTSISFLTWGGGNFTAGTRITVFARRSQ